MRSGSCDPSLRLKPDNSLSTISLNELALVGGGLGGLSPLARNRSRHRAPHQCSDRRYSPGPIHWHRQTGTIAGRFEWLVVPTYHGRTSTRLSHRRNRG